MAGPPNNPPVNVHAAKTHLSKLVRDAEAGQSTVIARNGKPVAKLVPYTPDPPAFDFRIPGQFAGKMPLPDDFDDTPQEIIDLFEGNDPDDPLNDERFKPTPPPKP